MVSPINIQDRDNIKVYYYGKNPLALEVNGRRYLFDPAEEGRPSVQVMSFTTIELANSKSPVFATGALVFSENERNDIFKALGNPEWRDAYWSEADIDDLLTRPAVDKLNRMLRVRDMLTIERIRGRMIYLRNTSPTPPSERVVDLVNFRFEEIRRGVTKSTKIAKPSDAGVSKEAIEAERLQAEKADLQKKNEAMEEELKQMKEMLAQLLAAQNKPEEKRAEAKQDEASQKKPSGRPPKKTT